MAPVKYTVEVTEEALRQLEEIREYVSANSPQNAVRLMDELFESFEQLSNFPFRHRVDEIIGSGSGDFRFYFVHRYKISYLVRGSRIFILRVWHGSRSNA